MEKSIYARFLVNRTIQSEICSEKRLEGSEDSECDDDSMLPQGH